LNVSAVTLNIWSFRTPTSILYTKELYNLFFAQPPLTGGVLFVRVFCGHMVCFFFFGSTQPSIAGTQMVSLGTPILPPIFCLICAAIFGLIRAAQPGFSASTYVSQTLLRS